MGEDPADRWSALGEFIREQRSSARLSLRRLSELAGISNPYLSQIERGLRRPSADILQQIAKALRISAETLYVQAGILDPPSGSPDLARQILADAHLTEEQKQALVRIYLAFRHESDPGGRPPSAPDLPGGTGNGPGRASGQADSPGRPASGQADSPGRPASGQADSPGRPASGQADSPPRPRVDPARNPGGAPLVDGGAAPPPR